MRSALVIVLLFVIVMGATASPQEIGAFGLVDNRLYPLYFTSSDMFLTIGQCGGSNNALAYTYDSQHFHIEYGALGTALTLSDYVTALEAAWQVQVEDYGWAAPPVKPDTPPPGNRYHVRIDSLGADPGYIATSGMHAGLVGDNPNTTWNEWDAYATCMVLNRNYDGFLPTPEVALQAVVAYEFNRALQFGYGALHGDYLPDDIFSSGGAAWMEDEVFDDANANYSYLWPVFTSCLGEYDAPASSSNAAYWIVLRALSECFGKGFAGGSEQIWQDFWEATSQEVSGNLAALDAALVNQGSSLPDAFHDAAIALIFNKACDGGYIYPYCLAEGPDYVAAVGPIATHGEIDAIGESYTGSIEDNYAMNWVGLPTGSGPYDVMLSNTSQGGQVRGSVVCDTGSELRVHALPSLVSAGGFSTLSGFDPSGCLAVVGVLTNQAQSDQNPTVCLARNYQLQTMAYVPASETPTPTITATPTGTITLEPSPTYTNTPEPTPSASSYLYLPVVLSD